MSETTKEAMPGTVSVPDTVPETWRLPWAKRGACHTSTLGPDAWFPVSAAPEASAAARAVCADCEVRITCLGQAMLSHHVVGIWGGTDEHERRRAMRRERRRA